MFLSRALIFSFKKFSFIPKYLNVTVAMKSNVQKSGVGYPLNYFLEHEAKIFQQDDKLNKSLKRAILSKSVEKLKYTFQEQNFVMALYRIAYYLEEDSEKQLKAYKEMNSILTSNYKKLEKFSSCFTILFKTMDGTFKFDDSFIELLTSQALVTMKKQYTFRDYGSMLASFYGMINSKDWKGKNEKQKKELEDFIKKNKDKIGFDASLHIAILSGETTSEKDHIDVFLKILGNLEKYLLFFDFLKYFKLLRVLVKVFTSDFQGKFTEEDKEQILKLSDAIIKGFNDTFREKMSKNFQGITKLSNSNNLIIKEYYQDMSLLLKIYVDLKILGISLREMTVNKDQNYNPEKEFEKLFLDKNFVLGEVGKKQHDTCLAFYDKFLKKDDGDESLKRFIDILFK